MASPKIELEKHLEPYEVKYASGTLILSDLNFILSKYKALAANISLAGQFDLLVLNEDGDAYEWVSIVDIPLTRPD